MEGGVILAKTKQELFTRFPNEYIRCNIKSKFGISRKFYIVYTLINKYRSYENYSWITGNEIINMCGYKNNSKKIRPFREIIDVLEFMISRNMIVINHDLSSLAYDTGIKIKIIPENFDCPENFTILTSSQFDAIMTANTPLNKENILLAFLYICSYIGCRPRNDDGTEKLPDPSDSPEAFFRSLAGMANVLAMSKSTISQCIDFLTGSTNDHPALLMKKEMDDMKIGKVLPNIYVLNKKGYQREIKWAQKKLREIYSVETSHK